MSNSVRNRRKSSNKQKNFLFFLIPLITATLILFVISTSNTRNDVPKTSNTPVNTNNSVNLDPPTQQEKKATEENKLKNFNEKAPSPTIDKEGLRIVTPIISFADKYGASAFIEGIFEEGGVCTADFTKGEDKITTTSVSFKNSNYTSCAPLNLPGPLNIKGDWSVIVSYRSSTSSGKSNPYLIKVE